MANKQTVITITHRSESYGQAQRLLLVAASKPRIGMVKVGNFFNAVAGGLRDAKATIAVNTGDAVAASGTITLASFAAADTITVAGQTFTASASPSGNNQFLVTGGDTAAAAAAVVKINAHPTLAQVVTATSSGAVITVTAFATGQAGNLVALAISAHGSVSGSTLANGANATTTSATSTLHCGV